MRNRAIKPEPLNQGHSMRAKLAGHYHRDRKLRAAIAEPLEGRLLFTTYYVDTNSTAASDNNAGTTLTAPLKTINQALTLVSNDDKSIQSDTVLILGGVYHEQPFVWASDGGTSAANRTVISAYINPATGQYEPVYIDAANPLTGTWVQDGTSNRWYLPNFNAMTSGVWVNWSGSNDGASLQQIGTYNDGFPDERTIFGSDAASMTPGSYYGDLADDRLYVCLKDGSNPNLHSLEYAANDHAIYQPGTSAPGGGYTYASNIDFDGLNLRHGDVYNNMGQDGGCAMYTVNNERLIDCNIQWNQGTGVILRDTSQMIDCISSNNGRNGVSAQGHGFLIDGGQYNYNYWRLNTDASEAGIKVIDTDPTLQGDIENAEIAYNYGKGIWFDTCFENSTVNVISGNYIHDNQDDGIDLEASRVFLVADNVIADNQTDGIFLNAVEDASIDNNTIVGNHGVAAIELDGGSRSQGNVYPGTIATLSNSVENNIIANNFSVYDLDVPTIANGSATISNNTSDYNLFYRQGGLLKFSDGGDYIGWGQTPSTLGSWQTDSGQDAHSIVTDPMFIGNGAAAMAYEIGANSPAIGIGANLSSTFTTGYSGTTRPAAGFDIGAFQHAGSTNGTAGPVIVNTDPTVWVDDQLPANAEMTEPDEYSNLLQNRFWQWDSQSSYSGDASLDSTVVAGVHRQYFTGADPRTVSPTDILFSYVWIDPQNLPQQIMLEWQDSNGSWAHQAYWGTSNLIGAGVDGSAAAHAMGALPAAGEWVQLAVPAATVGLAGESITGFSFDLYNGRALLDKIGNGPASTISTSANTASLSGEIFQDNNGNGILDNGESGLAGRTIFLDLNDDGIDDAGDLSTTTDSTGHYLFSALAAGSYTVRQELPSGFVTSTPGGATAVVTLDPTTGAMLNFSEFPTVFRSTAGADSFIIALSANQATVNIWQDQPETAQPDFSVLRTMLPSLSFSAGSFGGSFTVDCGNGTPLPSGDLTLNGGIDSASLNILGAASANIFKITSTYIICNSSYIDFSNFASLAITGGSGNDLLSLASVTLPVNFTGISGNDVMNISSGTYAFSSDPQIATPNLTVSVASGASVSFAARAAGSGINVYHLAALKFAAEGLAVLSPSPGNADRSLLVVDSLTFAGTTANPSGLLNLSNNDLIVRSGNVGAINTLMNIGYAAGTWASPAGVASSSAEFDPQSLRAIGMATGVTGTFDGEPVTTGDVELKYTFYGDTNLDGVVDASDYSILTNAATSHATGWWNGDFNYDGEVDGSDYTLIDNAFNADGAPLSMVASPAAIVAPTNAVPVATIQVQHVIKINTAIDAAPETTGMKVNPASSPTKSCDLGDAIRKLPIAQRHQDTLPAVIPIGHPAYALIRRHYSRHQKGGVAIVATAPFSAAA
jgi:hypothetical protein